MPPRDLMFTSRKFRVERCRPEGGAPPVDIVVHPGAALILPLLPDGRILLIRNFRRTVNDELLELPCGTLEPPEPPQACAARELSEETGYRAGRLRPLVSFYASPGILTERIHAFVATDLTPGEAHLAADERIRPAPLAAPEALDAIRDGRICDAKTMLALLYYERFGKEPG